jgi:hypothetical protein
MLSTNAAYTRSTVEKILYPVMALTITGDMLSVLESQQAIAMVIKAPPVSLQIKMALTSVSAVPSNMDTTQEGMITSANPVLPSNIAVSVSNDFIVFEVHLILKIDLPLNCVRN